MAFTTETTITATAIGAIVVILKDAFDEQGEPYQSAAYQVEVVRSDGSKVSRRGDLQPHLTPGQIAALLDFMADLRTQAEGECLPT